MAKKHGGKRHTGHIRPKDMSSLIDGHGGRDPHASAEHHAANKKHAMPEGLGVQGDFDGEAAGKGMGNEECCE